MQRQWKICWTAPVFDTFIFHRIVLTWIPLKSFGRKWNPSCANSKQGRWMLFRMQSNVLFRRFLLLIAQAGSNFAITCTNLWDCYNYSKRRFFFYRINAMALFFHKLSLWFFLWITKPPRKILEGFHSSRRLPIFTRRVQRTILSTSELNFCVRNGNRWNLTVIVTDQYDWLSITYLFYFVQCF